MIGPNQDLKRARFWIQRWRAIGGGFQVRAVGPAVQVQLARTIQEDEQLEAIYARTANLLEQELLDAPKKRETVYQVVSEYAVQNQPPQPAQEAANDQEPNATP